MEDIYFVINSEVDENAIMLSEYTSSSVFRTSTKTYSRIRDYLVQKMKKQGWEVKYFTYVKYLYYKDYGEQKCHLN